MSRTSEKPKKRAGKVIHGAVTLHASEKAKEIRARYGPHIDYPVLLAVLEDRREGNSLARSVLYVCGTRCQKFEVISGGKCA